MITSAMQLAQPVDDVLDEVHERPRVDAEEEEQGDHRGHDRGAEEADAQLVLRSVCLSTAAWDRFGDESTRPVPTGGVVASPI